MTLPLNTRVPNVIPPYCIAGPVDTRCQIAPHDVALILNSKLARYFRITRSALSPDLPQIPTGLDSTNTVILNTYLFQSMRSINYYNFEDWFSI